MADLKVSELGTAGTVQGTDLLYIVQGAASRKITRDTLMAGPFPTHTSTVDPTLLDVPDGTWVVWNNSGVVKLWANVGGTLMSVALS